ncbi:hypothetical protein LTS08_005899 [Lithohypha guttulata]|uniref:Forkhead domain n=1 Tax=Lithohypha guttulata TaxID=1690604 RepID=UPI002DE122A6|nr:hypothetical protein LTR51_002412 [Lithohypha guttulata]KAK5099318.1 hypothetical protein LTS08_005899 [Lithohypha guttulata]
MSPATADMTPTSITQKWKKMWDRKQALKDYLDLPDKDIKQIYRTRKYQLWLEKYSKACEQYPLLIDRLFRNSVEFTKLAGMIDQQDDAALNNEIERQSPTYEAEQIRNTVRILFRLYQIEKREGFLKKNDLTARQRACLILALMEDFSNDQEEKLTAKKLKDAQENDNANNRNEVVATAQLAQHASSVNSSQDLRRKTPHTNLPPAVLARKVDAAYQSQAQTDRTEEEEQSAPEVSPDADSETEKPSYTYAQLIKMAIQESSEKRLPSSEIIDWIKNKFPYYEKHATGNWQRTIRNTLSSHKDFMQQGKLEDGKRGNYWIIGSTAGITPSAPSHTSADERSGAAKESTGEETFEEAQTPSATRNRRSMTEDTVVSDGDPKEQTLPRAAVNVAEDAETVVGGEHVSDDASSQIRPSVRAPVNKEVSQASRDVVRAQAHSKFAKKEHEEAKQKVAVAKAELGELEQCEGEIADAVDEFRLSIGKLKAGLVPSRTPREQGRIYPRFIQICDEALAAAEEEVPKVGRDRDDVVTKKKQAEKAEGEAHVKMLKAIEREKQAVKLFEATERFEAAKRSLEIAQNEFEESSPVRRPRKS